jgi:hypothetical protein
LHNANTLARADESPMNSWPTSEKSYSTHFGEYPHNLGPSPMSVPDHIVLPRELL